MKKSRTEKQVYIFWTRIPFSLRRACGHSARQPEAEFRKFRAHILLKMLDSRQKTVLTSSIAPRTDALCQPLLPATIFSYFLTLPTTEW